MFYTLSPQHIQKIKESIYPQEVNGEFLKTVLVNDYGTDNSIRVVFSVKDGLENDKDGNQIFKVFNNTSATKYMRLKLFEIKSQEMLKEVRIAKSILEMEKLIVSYGALSQDLVPSLDFVGDKYDLGAHVLLSDQNNAVELVYDVTFLLPREKIDFLTLGAVFYYDQNEYIKDQSIDSQFLEPKILVDKVFEYPLFVSNRVKEGAPVQDLRLLKSTFNNLKFFQELLEVITSDKSFDAVANGKRHVQYNRLNPSPATISRIMQLGKIKTIKSFKNKPKKFFSDAFYSRNNNKSLGLAFNFFFEEMLKDNSTYNYFLSESSLRDELLKRCKISSINVLRRSVREFNGKIEPQLDTSTVIVSSGEPKSSNIVLQTASDSGEIGEIQLGSAQKGVRTFAIEDKTLFVQQHRGLFQYGVEIAIADGITEFLTDHADVLSAQINQLKEYLEETNKIVRTSVNENYQSTINGSYDPQKNAFTAAFVKTFNLRRGGEPSFGTIVAEAASYFVATLKMFGILGQNTAEITNVIISMLHPTQTSAESIRYFIEIYQKLVSQIRRTVETNKNSSFKVQNWFSNEYVNNEVPINFGYKFLNEDYHRGLGVVKADSYVKKSLNDLTRYSVNPNLDSVDYVSTQFSFLSPETIFSKNKIIDFANLGSKTDPVNDSDFIDLEIDIKNINYLGSESIISVPKTEKGDLKTIEATKTTVRAVNLSKLLSLTIPNTNQPLRSLRPAVQNIIDQKNEEINETHLMISLTKAFDLVSGKYQKSINVPVRTGTKTKGGLPMQIDLLLNDKCALLKETDNYRRNLNVNSKFQFLFNTIHAVFVQEHNTETGEEQWLPLTKAKLEGLAINKMYLCRMSNFKHKSLGFDGLEQINLPVFNQHFFLIKESPVKFELDNNLEDIKTFVEILKPKIDIVLDLAPTNKLLPTEEVPFAPPSLRPPPSIIPTVEPLATLDLAPTALVQPDQEIALAPPEVSSLASDNLLVTQINKPLTPKTPIYPQQTTNPITTVTLKPTNPFTKLRTNPLIKK